MRIATRLLLCLLPALLLAAESLAQRPTRVDSRTRRAVAELAERWWRARPKTKFEEWDTTVRAGLEAEALQIPMEEGQLEPMLAILWKPVPKLGPRAGGKRGKGTIETPYGEAWFYVSGGRGKDQGLILGLHGGGEGAGSADEPRGKWRMRDAVGFYPQGIRLVHDTWNTVHGEKFLLTLLEIAKAQYRIDPDRVVTAGFSMGGTGSWFLAGRHPDLLAASLPFAGVLMAQPKSQLQHKEDVVRVQHGMVPNVRNLPMYYTIGLEDRNTMPGTYLFVWDRIEELRQKDPGGYEDIHFRAIPKLAHAFPPGEPDGALQFASEKRRDPYPRTVVWEYTESPFPLPDPDEPTDRYRKDRFYWLRCSDAVDSQTIRAHREGNRITLDVANRAGVRGITLYLNPEMIDPSEDVVVVHEGEEVYRGRPEPELLTVLETLDVHLDRRLVFDRKIEL